jgi:hypothetical protein
MVRAEVLVTRPIAVVEPQMEELFHAPFNAALLHAVALAYPNLPISFRGFPAHLEVVRGILAQHAPALVAQIEWRSTPLSPARSLPARWLRSGRLLRDVLGPRERVLFTSISRMQLLQLKRTMQDGDLVRTVLHGDLDQIERPSRERFPMSFFALERVLLRPHPLGLRYLLLSQSIFDNIPGRLRPAFADAGVIDHPYHFLPIRSAFASPPVFGIFGNTGDGRLLEQVAKAVKAIDPRIRFRLIGFLSDQATVDRLLPYVEEAAHHPLSRETFIERAESVTHALWLAPSDGFRLRASGTFYDALAYAKPLIYTANAYIDPYFAVEPGIGVRCPTLGEVPAAIVNLATRETSETYAAAVEAIERLRTRFTPEAQAKVLPAVLAWD